MTSSNSCPRPSDLPKCTNRAICAGFFVEGVLTLHLPVALSAFEGASGASLLRPPLPSTVGFSDTLVPGGAGPRPEKPSGLSARVGSARFPGPMRMSPASPVQKAVLLASLAISTAAGAHSSTLAPNRLAVLAQAATMDCRPGDSTMTCCIKKHPQDPAGACGATPSEVDQVLRAVRADSDVDEGEDDFSNNASLPKWKQKCIEAYNDCQNDGWTGDCHDCLRSCEGQHKWPTKKCH